MLDSHCCKVRRLLSSRDGSWHILTGCWQTLVRSRWTQGAAPCPTLRHQAAGRHAEPSNHEQHDPERETHPRERSRVALRYPRWRLGWQLVPPIGIQGLLLGGPPLPIASALCLVGRALTSMGFREAHRV